MIWGVATPATGVVVLLVFVVVAATTRGNTKANVFPHPVGACKTVSRPFQMRTKAAC